MFEIRSHPTSAAAKHLTTFPDPTVISQGSLGNQSFKYTLHRLNRNFSITTRNYMWFIHFF